jgi:hypothetical protein
MGNPVEIAKHLIENRVRFGQKEHLGDIANAVQADGGKLVQLSFDPDGEWCGTGHFPHWPPKGLASIFTVVAKYDAIVKIFPLGIPVPDSFDAVIERQVLR